MKLLGEISFLHFFLGFFHETFLAFGLSHQTLLIEVKVDLPFFRKQGFFQAFLVIPPFCVLVIVHDSVNDPRTVFVLFLSLEELYVYSLSVRIEIFVQKQFFHLLVYKWQTL